MFSRARSWKGARQKPKRGGLWAWATLAGAILTCAGPEEKLVSQFFTATREKDLAMLAETSVVGFPVAAVHSWKVEGLTEERQEVFLINALQKKLDRARRARARHHRALRRFRREHKSTLAQFRSQMNAQPDFTAQGENEELFSTWQKMEKADRLSKSRLDSVRQKVELERKGARKSMNTWTPVDEFDGNVTVRDVLVSVDAGDGETIDYLLTLKKYTLEHKKEKKRPEARWILTEIQERGSP
jgi:hypothetical protein